MDQLIKVCILILSFTLLWDYNFTHLKVEQYAKNADPVNEGEGASQGTAAGRCECLVRRNLRGERLRKTSLHAERQCVVQTVLLHSLASHQRGDFAAVARWCFDNLFISRLQLLRSGIFPWVMLVRTTLCNHTEK